MVSEDGRAVRERTKTSLAHAASGVERASNKVMDTSFEEFARERTADLLRTAYLLTDNQQDAEDLAQDTLVKAQMRWKQVMASRNRTAYVHRMLTNHFLSGKRRGSARHELLTGREHDGERSDFVDVLAERDALSHALARLPKRERTALVLRHYLHLDNHEVALAMGVTDSTARSTLSRGIRSLRAELHNPVGPTVRSEET